MKPPSNAVTIKSTIPTELDSAEWGMLFPHSIPLVLHRPTGLVFGIAEDETTHPDLPRVYAVPLGLTLDEHGNYRVIGKIATDKVGQKAVTAYLQAMAGYMAEVRLMLPERKVS